MGGRRGDVQLEIANCKSSLRSETARKNAYWAVLIGGLFFAGCSRPVAPHGPAASSPAREPLPFTVVDDSGVEWETRSGRGSNTTILDTIGHGVALLDYDGDDLLDLVFTG